MDASHLEDSVTSMFSPELGPLSPEDLMQGQTPSSGQTPSPQNLYPIGSSGQQISLPQAASGQ